MRYIQSTQNQSGAYPPAQEDWFPGCIPLTDEQADMLVRHNGFVSITSEPDPEMEGSPAPRPGRHGRTACRPSRSRSPRRRNGCGRTWTFWLL